MEKSLSIRPIVFALLGLLLVACGPGNVAQITSEPSIESITPSTEPSRTPVQTLSPTSTNLPPTPEPIASLKPIAEGADMWIDSWSPDGEWLGLWLWTPDNKAAGIEPPGKLILVNPHTDESCEYADFVFSENYPQLFWQPEGRVALYHTDSYWVGVPCQDFAPVQAVDIEFDELPDETQSPGGTYHAETKVRESSGGQVRLTTTITNNTNGQVENRIDWSIEQRLGDLGLGGNWLTDDLFLIRETRDNGPLLIKPGGDVIQVAPELFGIAASEIQENISNEVSLRAIGAWVDEVDHFHMLLHGVGYEENFPRVHLFHSDTGEVETLRYKHVWHPGLTADGQWVLLDSRPDIDGYESYALWIRPVDPPSSQMRLFTEGTYSSAWSPTQAEIAFGWTGELTVFGFPDGESIRTWTTGEYSNSYLLWSPTGEFLATSGNIPGKYAAAAFVANMSE